MLFLALRHLAARKKQTFFTVLGIFFGTAAFVVISTMMLGFREYLLGELVNNDAHVHIKAREEFLEEHSLDRYFSRGNYLFWKTAPSGRISSEGVTNPEKWYQILEKDPRVAFFSPQCATFATCGYGKSAISTNFVGCDPAKQKLMTKVGSHMTAGNFADLERSNHCIVLGHQVEKKLGVKLAQNILVSTPFGPPIPFKVVGIFRTDNVFLDFCAYGKLEDVQLLKNSPRQVTEIAVKLHDHSQALKLASLWSGLGLEKIESWDQINANIFEMFKIQDAVRFLSVGAVLLVAGFGIYNVLNMTVMQKRKDIAILRSMGYSTKEVVFLFFSQGLILGLAGASLGLIFGYFFGLYLETIPFGGGPLSMGPGHLMVSRSPWIYLQGGVMGLLSSALASLLPARSSGRLSPIEIIRAGAE
ncbi:MAG: FtsX-like permease family protein [Parachlamydiales bacterium]|jgi:lipoprotein-releasing system permease protein